VLSKDLLLNVLHLHEGERQELFQAEHRAGIFMNERSRKGREKERGERALLKG
jgi:hypothetical protein